MSYFFLFFPVEHVIIVGSLVVATLLMFVGLGVLQRSSAEETDGSFVIKASIGDHVFAGGWLVYIGVLSYVFVNSIHIKPALQLVIVALVLSIWAFYYYRRCMREFSFDNTGIIAIEPISEPTNLHWEDLNSFRLSDHRIDMTFSGGQTMSVAGWLPGSYQLHNLLTARYLGPSTVERVHVSQSDSSDPWQELKGKGISISVLYVDQHFEIAGDTFLEGSVEAIGDQEIYVILNESRNGMILSIPKESQMHWRNLDTSSQPDPTQNDADDNQDIVAVLYSMEQIWCPSVDSIGTEVAGGFRFRHQ
ncbi:MAG: hypothetical protein AAFO01_17655 [Pseudomonadota bacterium]